MSAEIRLRHFAALREQRGTDRETLTVEPGTTLRDVYERLFDTVDGSLPVACMRNQVRAAPDTLVEDGDEVAFLPPFGGG